MRPLICRLVNWTEAATSQMIQVAFGFAGPLAPTLYRLTEKRVRIGLG
jgi:hypothetical protein